MSLKDRFSRFMIGRYGVDDFSKFLLYLAIGLMVLNMFVRVAGLNTLVMIDLLYVYFRMFSRNISARYRENSKYLEFKGKYLSFFTGFSGRMADRKANHIYKCPSCGQKIRIPRGRGNIVVTCPKCRHEFNKKS